MLIPSPDVTFGPWGTEDSTPGPLLVPYVTEDGDPVDLDGFTVADARAYTPAGGAVSDVVADIVETVDGMHIVEYTFPAEEWLLPGIWSVTARLTGDGGGNSYLPAPFAWAVEDRLSGWQTIAGIRLSWRDAPRSDIVLYNLLSVARSQVEAWAIPVPETDPPTLTRPSTNLVVAQGMQARNIWNAIKTDPSTFGIGEGEFVIRPFPMDPVVKDLIRPKSPKPVVA